MYMKNCDEIAINIDELIGAVDKVRDVSPSLQRCMELTMLRRAVIINFLPRAKSTYNRLKYYQGVFFL